MSPGNPRCGLAQPRPPATWTPAGCSLQMLGTDILRRCPLALQPPSGPSMVPFPRAQSQYSKPMAIPGRDCQGQAFSEPGLLGGCLGKTTSFLSGFPNSREPDTSGPIRASRACHDISDGPGPNPVWEQLPVPRGQTAATPGAGHAPAPAAPPPLPAGLGSRALAPPPHRHGSSRFQRPGFPSAGSGATFPFRLRVPKRSWRPDGGAERRRRRRGR